MEKIKSFIRYVSIKLRELASAYDVDDKYWALALSEFDSELKNNDLWAKCLTKSKFNELEAKSLYIKIRSKQLADINGEKFSVSFDIIKISKKYKDDLLAFAPFIKKALKFSLFALAFVFSFIFLEGKYNDWRQYENYGKHLNKITVKAYYDSNSGCEDPYPYTYAIHNFSEKTISRTTFDVSITKKGFSEKINSYTLISESKIIKPYEGYEVCFSAENKYYNGSVLVKDVLIHVNNLNIDFLD